MFFPFFDPASIAGFIKLQQLERERWDKLTNDQKLIELRQREVRALERQASALEERNEVERGKFF